MIFVREIDTDSPSAHSIYCRIRRSERLDWGHSEAEVNAGLRELKASSDGGSRLSPRQDRTPCLLLLVNHHPSQSSYSRHPSSASSAVTGLRR